MNKQTKRIENKTKNDYDKCIHIQTHRHTQRHTHTT